MKSEDIDDIAKQLETMDFGFRRSLLTAAAAFGSSATSASHSTPKGEGYQGKEKEKEKENTPPREIIIPVLEPSAEIVNDDVPPGQVHKWKLKHRTVISMKAQHQMKTDKMLQPTAQPEPSPPSPPHPQATSLVTFRTPNTPAPPQPASLRDRLLHSPPIPSSPNEDTIVSFPYLSSDMKATVASGGLLPPRRPTLKPRRRPLGRPSPLHKKPRSD